MRPTVTTAADLHDFVLVLSKEKPKQKLLVLTGENTIAKAKKILFWFWLCPKPKQNRAGQISSSMWATA